VTTWADAHARAAVRASQLHAQLGLDLTHPVDVFAAAQRLGIVLAFDELGDTSGLYLPAGPEQPLPGILLNSQHPRSRQRYTCGHELGHHVFGHDLESDGDLESEVVRNLERGTLERWSDAEKEAEAFGAWFLMPRRLLRAGLASVGLQRPRHPLDVYALSLWLGTSYNATARQLGNTRMLPGAVADDWAKLSPRSFKSALSEGLVLPSYRNDVWWLDERAHQQPVDMRPGDRLIINLPEDPSTGYTWTIETLPGPLVVKADSFFDDYAPPVDRAWMGPSPARPPSDPDGEGLDSERVGGPISRAFALDVDATAVPGIHHLMFRYARDWEDRPLRDFELLVSITAALSGVQLRPDQLALRP
jgi:Zn-dependent peptidase ImmA (M78 family)